MVCFSPADYSCVSVRCEDGKRKDAIWKIRERRKQGFRVSDRLLQRKIEAVLSDNDNDDVLQYLFVYLDQHICAS